MYMQTSTYQQVNHYYPYGGVMGESTGGDIQKYKYNGKRLERNHGLDWYDYGKKIQKNKSEKKMMARCFILVFMFVVTALCHAQNNMNGLYDNLSYTDGVCYKEIEVTYQSIGRSPLNGQFGRGMSEIMKKKDIPQSSMYFIYNNKPYYINLSNDFPLRDYEEGERIVLQIVFYENVKQPYDYIYPYSIIIKEKLR